MWTGPFERFVAPARQRPQLWRTLLGFLLIVTVTILGAIAVMIAFIVARGLEPGMGYFQTMETEGATPTLVIIMLGLFIFPFAGALLAARVLHERAPGTLLGPGLLRGFGMAVAGAALVYLAVTVLLPATFDLEPNLPFEVFLGYLPFALVVLLIQTGAEEIVFRGYLQTQLAARFGNPLVWMLVPALGFGLLHGDPSGGVDKLWLMLPPTLFGLIAADLTRVTGSIGAAWGLHFLNNVSAILFVSLDGELSGLALYRAPFGVDDISLADPLIWQDMVTTVIIWACLRLWLARRSAQRAL